MDLKIYNQIFYNIVEITQLFPQYTITQHFSHIMRTKGDAEGPYMWTNEKLLTKVEKYCEELKNELSLPLNHDN